MAAHDVFRLASRSVDQLQETTDELHAKLTQLADKNEFRDFSPEWKEREAKEAKQAFQTTLPGTVTTIRSELDRADRLASTTLSGSPDDEALETRKQRAGARVVRLLDAGKCPGEVAELLAATGDVDGYRALRDEIPAWVAATMPAGKRVEAEQRTREHLLTVDRAMAPALSGDLAAAVRVRLGVDGQRARLDAIVHHATNPTPMTLLRRAYANAG